jgi:hypothetical protein
MTQQDQLVRAVKYGIEKGHSTLIVPLDLLKELLDRIEYLERYRYPLPEDFDDGKPGWMP